MDAIIEFIKTISGGVVYVTGELFNAPSTLAEWIAALPSEWTVALTGFITASIALAVIRWVT